MTNEERLEITDSEWEVMRVVWTRKKATSKEIINILLEKKDWKPATTKTFIGRLVKKGALDTETVGNKFIYTAAISEEDSLKSLKEGLFSHICNTAVGKTIADLISEATLSHSDIAMIEEVLQTKKKDAVDVIVCDCVPGQCHCKENHDMDCH
jgi:CopY/TcrY family copper transport repressor